MRTLIRLLHRSPPIRDSIDEHGAPRTLAPRPLTLPANPNQARPYPYPYP